MPDEKSRFLDFCTDNEISFETEKEYNKFFDEYNILIGRKFSKSDIAAVFKLRIACKKECESDPNGLAHGDYDGRIAAIYNNYI